MYGGLKVSVDKHSIPWFNCKRTAETKKVTTACAHEEATHGPPRVYHASGHPITVMCDPCGKNTGNNHDDANALAVYNARGELIGYIPKQWAQMLGPAVLQNAIRVDGKITWHGGPSNVHLKCRIEPLIKPAEQVTKT
jgi:hypothetical protein